MHDTQEQADINFGANERRAKKKRSRLEVTRGEARPTDGRSAAVLVGAQGEAALGTESTQNAVERAGKETTRADRTSDTIRGG